MKAYSKGYSFEWIEGEMHEKSPFTIMDFLRQRRRWLLGILLVVHSKVIPLKHKIFVTISVYAKCAYPIVTSNIILSFLFPLPHYIINLVFAFFGVFSAYMYLFGLLKSFPLYRFGLVKSMICIIGSLCLIPFSLFIENAAVVWGLLDNRYQFYVVQKDVASTKKHDLKSE